MPKKKRKQFKRLRKSLFGKETFQPHLMLGGYTLQEAYNKVDKLQTDFAKDLSIGISNKRIKRYQTLIVRSLASRIVAVHRVIRNKGYRSKGLGKQPKTNAQYQKIVEELREVVRCPKKYKATPLQRIMLEKPNKPGEFRPISIPTIFDRCVQALYHMALDPIAEHNAEPSSYGFRKGRSTIMAASDLHLALVNKFHPSYAIEVDISKCFDSISHDWMLANIPIDKRVLKAWLKQGFIYKDLKLGGNWNETPMGIPQGGIISPTLCNITLDGLTKFIRSKLFELIKSGVISLQETGYVKFRPTLALIHTVRYADDMVILWKSKTICDSTQTFLDEFLLERGLKGNKTKTKVPHLMEPKAYMDFLGYRVQKEYYKPNRYRKGEKWFIETPPKALQNLKEKLSETLKKCRNGKEIFQKDDPILRGWLNYYSATNARKVFKKVNRWFFKFMLNSIIKFVSKWKFLRKKRRVRKTKMYTLIFRRYLVKLDLLKSSRWFRYIDPKGPERKKNLVVARPNGFPLLKPKPSFIPKASFYDLSDRTKLAKLALEYKNNKFKSDIYEKSEYKCQRCQNNL